jgi:UDP-3-O-[3-hydroxymyristoyl] N-acetylglucosamine deacetylase
MTLRPAPADSGIIFRRVDLGIDIRASWANTVASPLCTLLADGDGNRIGTIEHLMAALAGSEIDNALVELDGPEVPVLDGSAAPFLELIDHAGIAAQHAARRAIKICNPVQVSGDGASAALLPGHGFSMGFEIDFDNPLIRRQDMDLSFEPDTFRTELSRARSFCFLDEVDRMRAAGFARGGSLDNAVVVSGDRILNRGGLRYSDEFVRHKLLDAFGDLYLAGAPLIGHFRGCRSGHALTRRLLVELFADPTAWCETTLPAGAPFGAVAWPRPLHLASA